MNILLSEHLLLLLSLNRLSIYLNDILKQGQFRTVIFYYENETAFVATHLINMISRNERIIFSYVTFNIDGDHSVSNINHNMGTVFFNICVFDNIISGKHLLNEEPYFHPRFHSVYISQQNATNQQISDFFESVWEYSVLNAGLIFWTGPVRIYTHFPYQKKFLVKLFAVMVYKISCRTVLSTRCLNAKLIILVTLLSMFSLIRIHQKYLEHLEDFELDLSIISMVVME